MLAGTNALEVAIQRLIMLSSSAAEFLACWRRRVMQRSPFGVGGAEFCGVFPADTAIYS